MKPDHSDALEAIAARTGHSPLVVLEMFLERAAIREYEGGYPRDRAEALAVGDTAEALGLPVERAAHPENAIGCDPQTCSTCELIAPGDVS